MKSNMRTLLLLLLCSFPFLSATAQEEVAFDGIRYKLSEEGAVVAGYDNEVFDKVVIPDSIIYLDDGGEVRLMEVTGIGSYAFSNCTGLTEITIPNSVTSIGGHAFYGCTGLTEITIPNSVTSIGLGAFNGCGLTKITIPNSVTSIGGSAFNYCVSLVKIEVESGNPIYDSRDNCNSIIETASNELIQGCKNSTIPSSVTNIGEYAFAVCNGLTEITIPNSVTSIGGSAFFGCTGLTEITIPNGVTSIGDRAFNGCRGLTKITIPNSVTSISESAFDYCVGLVKIEIESGNPIYDSRDNCNCIIETATNELVLGCMNSTIPSSVTSIGEYAFSGCEGLTEITIPNGVTSIGDNAFNGCRGLTKITIPNSVTSIGEYAFRGCTGLTEITIPNSVTSIGDWAFNGCGLTKITIPNSVTSIEGSAFNYCVSLVKIEVESGNPVYDSRDNSNCIIETASNELIQGCNNSTIPNSVTSIGEWAFYYCTGLTEITIPNSVTSIGEYAFSDCTGLTEITIPSSVTSIENYAFSGCDSLRTVVCKNEVPPTLYYHYGGVFDEATTSTAKLVVPEESINAYKAAEGWKDFRNIESLTAIRKVSSGEPEVKAVYSADGVKLSKPQKGINIIVGKDGKSKKVLVR